ncbi:MAG: hypothetical protein GF384_05790 [Elusimicrobia bacterium]|nr:hypothetical protein [Elusimicrobiota bacterium]
MRINWKKIDIKKLALIISSELKENNIDAVLVGGACVSIYARNEYVSMDLDYVTYTPIKELTPVLNSLGFYQQSSRHFEHSECPFSIEFLSPPVSIGHECPIKKLNKVKSLILLTPTDCVKDRLAAYYHWNDMQSLDQAVMVAKAQRINLKSIKEWSAAENSLEKYRKFESRLKVKQS